MFLAVRLEHPLQKNVLEGIFDARLSLHVFDLGLGTNGRRLNEVRLECCSGLIFLTWYTNLQ